MSLTHLNRATHLSQPVVLPGGCYRTREPPDRGRRPPPVDASGAVVGAGLREQTPQALRNVLTVLGEVDADPGQPRWRS